MVTKLPAMARTTALQKLKCRQADIRHESVEEIAGKEFVIWFSARSGSTWLGSLLFSAGFPKPEEYFHPNKVVRRAAYLGVNSWPDYVRAIKQKRTVSGLFCHEMTFQFWNILKKDGDAMNYLDFSGPSVVLFREDIVLQAVSLFLAMNSQKWHKYQGSNVPAAVSEVAYSENAIRKNVEYLLALENGLNKNRDELIRNARYVSYECLIRQSNESIIDAFSRHAGFEARAGVSVRSHYTRMRTTKNLQMSERFVENNRQWVAEINDSRNWIFSAMENSPLIVKQAMD